MCAAWAEETPAAVDPTVRRTDPAASEGNTRDLGITSHEPVYFSLGAVDTLNAKFQLSFKFRLFGDSDDRVHGECLYEDFYLAYTQTSIWDLESESKPFFDTSYRPSVFWMRRNMTTLLGGQFSLRTGFEHESNGKGGVDSRSINIAFLRPSLWWDVSKRWSLAVSPKLYAYLERSENEDIGRYRGYADWQFILQQQDSKEAGSDEQERKGLRLAVTGRLGTSGRASALVDASLPLVEIPPLKALGMKHGYLHLQYFNGYGETILTYDERLHWQLRLGLMLVR